MRAEFDNLKNINPLYLSPPARFGAAASALILLPLVKPPVCGAEARRAETGGAEGNRTPDLDIANVALSQLSYGPV